MYGYGGAKEWGLELAQDLIDWQRGRIDWSEVDTGIVLSGPPGVGKTQFAAALARQCSVPIIAASLARWQARGHLGDLLKAMRSDFDKAKESAPCILFCDELDSFGDRNSFSADNKDYSTQVVNGFLEHLDGLDGREGVVVIGATNNVIRKRIEVRARVFDVFLRQ
ncbi:ATP-binding protein [Ensifer sesbaniae]|nr:ATP-binding protein [Ensifer sesbaniae]